MNPSNWLPTYPDVLVERRSRREPAVAFTPHSTQAYPIPDLLASLSFAPRFPDRVPPDRTRRLWSISSIVDPLVGFPLVWLPVAPEQVPHTRAVLQPLVADPSFGAGMAIAASLAWQAGYPERVPLLILLQTGGAPFQVDPSLLGLAPCVHVAEDAAAMTSLVSPALTSPRLIEEALASPGLLGEDLC